MDRVVSISKNYRRAQIGIVTSISYTNPDRRPYYWVLLEVDGLRRGFFEHEIAILTNGVTEMIKCL
jgi:hypothetical protein